MSVSSKNDVFRKFLFSYRYDGAEWSIEIQARSVDEARKRISSLALARYDGEVFARYPATVGFIPRMIAFFRNARLAA
ncbi:MULTISPECIES: hypothetical protein [unclassified Brucella]|uniref:hypothetical protein n=1 Tax=unclassified Brucella TaxID=2632610 RepID=UPI00217E9174|nr:MULTISPECIES: hypothetical protein [unclassified Brucella]UWF67443.1 hypothetical protein NYO63_04740 [Brucella sp. 1315]UWF70569.1 hypothetical protein NYO65_04740 [Brucella sp. 2594]